MFCLFRVFSWYIASNHCLGPAAGSLLYSIGGYLLPFIFFGSLSLILVPPIGYYFKKFSRVPIDPIVPLIDPGMRP